MTMTNAQQRDLDLIAEVMAGVMSKAGQCAWNRLLKAAAIEQSDRPQ